MSSTTQECSTTKPDANIPKLLKGSRSSSTFCKKSKYSPISKLTTFHQSIDSPSKTSFAWPILKSISTSAKISGRSQGTAPISLSLILISTKSHKMQPGSQRAVCWKGSINSWKESGKMDLQSSDHQDIIQEPKTQSMDSAFTTVLRLAQITSWKNGKRIEWQLLTGTFITEMEHNTSCKETKTSC